MREKIKRFEKNKSYYYILSFLLPVIIFSLIFIVSRFYPFGKNQILVIDAYHQYYHFMLEIRGKILNGESLLYTWHMGLGTDFLSIMAYYCASPLLILSAIVPESLLSIFFALLIAIKVGIASLTFSMYLKSIYEERGYTIVVFSLCYSLCGFIAGYYWNIMWLDVFALFPIVILGLKNIIEKDKYIMYIITLGLCFLTNYYMSIFVCIFIVIYYIMYSILKSVKFMEFTKRGFKVLGSSIISAGLFAWILIPTAIGLTNVYKTASPFTGEIEIYNSFIDVLSNFLAFNFPTVREGLPNIYSSLIVLFLVFIYFFSSKIKIKEKIISLFLIFLLILSTNINLLNYIWHGFRYTNMLPYRFTFIISFILGIIAYKGYKNIGEFNNKEYFSIGMISLGLVIFLGSNRTTEVILANVILLTIYIILIFLRKVKKKRVFTGVLFLLIIAEFFANTYIGVSTAGNTDYDIFNRNKKEIDYFIEKIEDKDEFYRMEVLDRFTFNDPALYQYNGLSLFSSTTDARVSVFLEELGIPSYPLGNRYYYSLGTPFTNAIFNMDYLISRDTKIQNDYSFKELEELNNIYLYENEKSLPLGFICKKDSNKGRYYGNSFENQNTMFSDLTGETKKLFKTIDIVKTDSVGLDIKSSNYDQVNYTVVDDSGARLKVEYIIPEDGYYYIDTDMVEKRTVEIIAGDNSFNIDARRRNISAIGHYKKDEKLEVIVNLSSKDDGGYRIELAKLNEEIFNIGYNELKESSATNIEYDSTNVKMEIDAKEDGYLFMSIPYNEGWTLYIDGEKQDITPFQNAFIGANIKSGKHMVELKYNSVGFKEGLLISGVSILTIGIIIYIDKKKRKLQQR